QLRAIIAAANSAPAPTTNRMPRTATEVIVELNAKLTASTPTTICNTPKTRNKLQLFRNCLMSSNRLPNICFRVIELIGRLQDEKGVQQREIPAPPDRFQRC